MHELSICRALINQVTKVADENNADRVISIRVAIGPLSGVEPQLLEQAYPIAATGYIAEDAELILDLLPVRVRCASCAHETEATPNRLICANCGDWHTTIVSGDELLLMSVELSTGGE